MPRGWHQRGFARHRQGENRTRFAERVHFKSLVDHGLKGAGCRDKLLTDSAQEILWRASHGVPRAASRLLRTALRQAHHENQSLRDDHVLTKVIHKLAPKQEHLTKGAKEP